MTTTRSLPLLSWEAWISTMASQDDDVNHVRTTTTLPSLPGWNKKEETNSSVYRIGPVPFRSESHCFFYCSRVRTGLRLQFWEPRQCCWIWKQKKGQHYLLWKYFFYHSEATEKKMDWTDKHHSKEPWNLRMALEWIEFLRTSLPLSMQWKCIVVMDASYYPLPWDSSIRSERLLLLCGKKPLYMRYGFHHVPSYRWSPSGHISIDRLQDQTFLSRICQESTERYHRIRHLTCELAALPFSSCSTPEEEKERGCPRTPPFSPSLPIKTTTTVMTEALSFLSFLEQQKGVTESARTLQEQRTFQKKKEKYEELLQIVSGHPELRSLLWDGDDDCSFYLYFFR